MALKPWYKVVTPREDLREGKPLDAAEFAVHLDQVREGRAPDDYKVPERFFERTYITHGLKSFSAEVIRRLSASKQWGRIFILDFTIVPSSIKKLAFDFPSKREKGTVLFFIRNLAQISPAKPSASSKKKKRSNTANTAPAASF